MKMNKKGFTLIELLAVIVILAVVALVATPIILASVNNAKQQAALASANNVITASNYNEQMVNFDASDIVGSYTSSRGTGDDANKIAAFSATVKFSGDQPSNINLTTDAKGIISSGTFDISGYTITVTNGKATTASK